MPFSRFLVSSLLSVAALIGASSASAATLNVVDGRLIGAFDVIIFGTLYDVEFVDGTCIALFSECDEYDDFTFTNQTSSYWAARALVDQVVLDGPDGLFASTPDLINGCVRPYRCNIYTPWQGTTLSYFRTAETFIISGPDSENSARSVGTSPPRAGSTVSDGTAPDDVVFAIWTPVPVPEPDTSCLMGVALLTLVLVRARRKA